MSEKKVFMKDLCGSQAGFGVPLVVITLFTLLGSLFLISTRTGSSFKENAGFRQRMDREIVKKVVLSMINCYETNRATFTSDELYYFPYQNRCTSTSYNQSGRVLRLSRLTPQGPRPLFGTFHPADGVYRVGDLQVRGTCSASENGYVIQAIPADIPGKGTVDKVSGKLITWNSKEALLIGKPARLVLCAKRPPPQLRCEGRACYDPNPQVFSVYAKE